MTYASRMTGKVFISFMRQSVRSANGTKIFLIVDNPPAHHSKTVKKWIDDRSDQIEIFFLPPYRPDLNHEELLNNIREQDIYSRSQPKTKEEYFENVRMTLKDIKLNLR
jgi:transposase